MQAGRIQTNITEYGIAVYCSNGMELAVAEASSICLKTPVISTKSTYYFNRINVPISMRGTGLGSKLLKELLKAIKELDVALKCDINPYGDMDYQGLLEWYIRNGFKEYGVGGSYELWYNL